MIPPWLLVLRIRHEIKTLELVAGSAHVEALKRLVDQLDEAITREIK